jgi:hypothetical protein
MTVVQSGMKVQIVGLKNRTDLNASHPALCLDFRVSSHRFSVKVISSGEEILVKPENLVCSDEVFEAVHSSEIGSIEMCHDLANAMVSHFGWSYDHSFHQMDSFLRYASKSASKRCLYQLLLWGSGHEFVMEFIESGDKSLFARVFQA